MLSDLAAGRRKRPTGAAVGSARNLYIADALTNRNSFQGFRQGDLLAQHIVHQIVVRHAPADADIGQ